MSNATFPPGITPETWQKMVLENEQIILVNSQDEAIGQIGKIEAHRGKGQLHRAITVVLFNPQGQVLITKRSTKKPLWPLYWDAACSTHPWIDEDCIGAAKRRLPFEIGLDVLEVKLSDAGSYEYHAVYNQEWSENEINHIVVGKIGTQPKLNFDEVIEFEWLQVEQVVDEIQKNKRPYAPWVKQALETTVSW